MARRRDQTSCLRGSIAHLGIAVVRRGSGPAPLIIFAILHQLSYIDHPTGSIKFFIGLAIYRATSRRRATAATIVPMRHPERSDATQIDLNERERRGVYNTFCIQRPVSMIKVNFQRNSVSSFLNRKFNLSLLFVTKR